MTIESCATCGFDPASVSPASAPEAVRAFARRYQAPLTRFLPDDDPARVLRFRVADGEYSALDRAGHIRDSFETSTRNVELLQHNDGSVLEAATDVAAGEYSGLDPVALVDAISTAANRLADTLASLSSEEWEHRGHCDGEPYPMREIAQRAVHDGGHHLLDIGKTLRAARGR